MNNALIFGRDELKNVVSCEVKGEDFIVFTEDNGKINQHSMPNENWVLANKPILSDFERLQGNLHYKFGKIYTDNDHWLEIKNKFYKYDTYFLNDDREANLIGKGITYYKGMKPQDVSILSFDIESTGLFHNKESRVLLIANTFRKNGQYIRKMFCYSDYDNEGLMIEAWCKWVREMDPSILLGHNILSYDIPYINYVANRYGITLNLGRDGSELKFNKKASKKRINGSREQEYFNVRCFGREIVDTMFLAINYDFSAKYESYGLKQIIKQEKLEDANRVFYDASQIRFKFHIPEEWEKIKKYAEFDGDDAIKLFDLMIPSYFYFNQSIPKTNQQMILSATGSQLNTLLVRSYLQFGHSIPKADPMEKYPGAISFGNTGIHKNVFKCDVASLYPSIILQYQIYDKEKDPQGNFLKMVRHFTEQRLLNKRLSKETGDKYYKDLEQAQKIGINSAYGLLGASGLNFNKRELADLVTAKGREALQEAIEWACGFQLIYDDINEEWKIPDEVRSLQC